MRNSIRRKLEEMNPASAGRRASGRDERAMKNKNIPFDYYAEQFYALEEIRKWLMSRSTSTQPFRKAAVLIEKAQNEMLKEGR